MEIIFIAFLLVGSAILGALLMVERLIDNAMNEAQQRLQMRDSEEA